MEYKEYRYVDKTGWPDGPWMKEPDKIQWQDEATGLPCLIVRGPYGSLCGYVGVTKGHPLFQLERDEIDLWVHGGITFAAFCMEDDKEHGICHVPGPGEPDQVYWLGFDCAHAGDLSPKLDALLSGLSAIRPIFDRSPDEYRTIEYVRSECQDLARQLHETEKEKNPSTPN